MSETPSDALGDCPAYRYIPGPFQYSAGVVAKPGFAMLRVRFQNPVPLMDGFARIEAFMTAEGLPFTAFGACELRSPAPFTDAGFTAFNREYVGTLERWGIFANDVNPVARSNVCPELHKPDRPSFHAFSLAVPSPGGPASFVIAGSGESMEAPGPYRDRTVAYGDTSREGMAQKIAHVMTTMERRLAAAGVTWADTTATQIYTVFDITPHLATGLVARGPHGTVWIGTIAGHPWWGWTTKWTAAACSRSVCWHSAVGFQFGRRRIRAGGGLNSVTTKDGETQTVFRKSASLATAVGLSVLSSAASSAARRSIAAS